jgi:hypothetical protein
MCKYFACLVKVKKKFLLATLKTLTISKDCSESYIKFLFRHSFALIGQFSTVYIHDRLLEQFLGSQVAFGITSRGCYWKAVTSVLKMLTGGIFTIIMLFHGSTLKLYCEFSAPKDSQKL